MDSFRLKAQVIWDELQLAKKVLINIHPHTDFDSVCSALAMRQILTARGKQVDLVSPEPLRQIFSFLPDSSVIKTADFATFDFSPYDYFVVLDTSTWNRAMHDSGRDMPDKKIIVIDHHSHNTIETPFKLVETGETATAKIIYKLCVQHKINLDPQLATYLFIGIADDSVYFQKSHHSAEDFGVAAELLKAGADIKSYLTHVFFQYEPQALKTAGWLLEHLQVDKEKIPFSWVAMDNKTYMEYGKHKSGVELVTNLFCHHQQGVDFGIVMTETAPGELQVSWRSLEKVDVGELARSLGGGGHVASAGCTIRLPFKQAVEKVLETARKA